MSPIKPTGLVTVYREQAGKVNQLIKEYRLPSQRKLKNALQQSLANLQLDNLAHGGKLVSDYAKTYDQPKHAAFRAKYASQIPILILDHTLTRPHIITRVARELMPEETAQTVVEFYSGTNPSGPLAFYGRRVDYFSVSLDPHFAGLNELPRNFLEAIGLTELKEYSLARIYRWFEPEVIQKLIELQCGIFPGFQAIFSEVDKFSELAEFANRATLGCTFFWAFNPNLIKVVKPGGHIFLMSTYGYQDKTGQDLAVKLAMKNLQSMADSDPILGRQVSFEYELSQKLSLELLQTKGYNRLGLLIAIYQKSTTEGV